MEWIAEMLTFAGEHIMFVVIGCTEILVAVILMCIFLNGKVRGERIEKSDIEQSFFGDDNIQKNEACIVIRNEDLMPVYAIGEIRHLLGVNLKMLQEDITKLFGELKDSRKGMGIWENYRSWDGNGKISGEFQMKDGQWIRMDCRRSRDRKYDMFFFRVTTGEHQQMEQYEKRLEAAEEASQSKTSFLYRMSHEIRTPMNGIMGMLTLAKEKLEPDHPAKQYLYKAEEVSGHLLALINDILDMSRIEAGKVELEEKVFSIRELGNRLYDMFVKNLDARGIRYVVNYENLSVDYVLGDELRISQIIINFLSNAVKFTKEGEVTVTFRQMMLYHGKMDLMVCVHDTGIGMDPEFISRIFRPFEQESTDIARQYGGTGLGMAITDQLVKLMHGEIVVNSIPGKGSDFSVFIQLPVAEAPVKTEAEVKKQKTDVMEDQENAFVGRRILLAEDNELNAVIAVEILQNMGAFVEVVENGKLAVEAFQSHEENYYDFILMDVQMPVMDGREAARTIRGLARKDAKEILIFALSADAFVEDVRFSKESGMNGHYVKPVDFIELQKSIAPFLQEKDQVR